MNRNEYKYLADNNNSELDIISQIQRENKELKARAEKAESELKAIRDRVKAVTEEDMGNTDLDVFIKYIIGGVK